MTLLNEILERRGLTREFLNPGYRVRSGELPEVERAAERMALAAERGEKVLIYGDYDVDGVTATTVMKDTLELLGVEGVIVMLPDRFVDGYGMSGRCVERAAS